MRFFLLLCYLMIARLPRIWPVTILSCGFLAALWAIGSAELWRVVPWQRFAYALTLAVASWTIALLFKRLTGWSLATVLTMLWVLALIFFVGITSFVAVTWFTLAALAVGMRLSPASSEGTPLALTVGMMAIAGVTGWALALPIHFALTWYTITAALIFWQRASLIQTLRNMRVQWQHAALDSPYAMAACVMLLGLASTACWLPTMQADDLTYHLGLPSQLLAHQRYLPDAGLQVWSFAPWANDTLHGVTAVMSHGETRGALNALWLLLCASLVGVIAKRLSATPREQWACVAVFCSFPPLVWLAAGMQTELPAIAVLLAFTALLLRDDLSDESRKTSYRIAFCGAVLVGGLFALKAIHALTALPLLAYGLWRYHHRLTVKHAFFALATVLLIGGSSYWFAWRNTGNPVLPLFNAVFASEFFPLHNFHDPRWDAGFSFDSIWQIVVNTDRYVEAWDGGLGFSLIALAGAWAIACIRSDRRLIALAATLTVLIPLIPMQYARYAYTGMVLVLTIVLPGTERLLGNRAFALAIISLCTVNLAFQANAGWTQHSAALKHLLRTGGNVPAVLTDYVPERLLIAAIPKQASSIVMATDPTRGFIAELAGRGRTVSWHDTSLASDRLLAEKDFSGQRWERLFIDNNVDWILVVPASASPALQRALQRSAVRTQQRGDAELWRFSRRGGTTTP